ncbi:MAG: peroxiredoxin-like family protein [Lentisphaeria bacterium]|nr:peroxiredoxin-like family protein [Lentisphaeria bacterium]
MHTQIIASAALGLLIAAGSTASAREPETAPPVPASAADVRPLLIGASVPEVTLRTADGKAFDLGAAASRKPAILIFYRGGWCPYCSLHLGQLQEAEADLVKLGYQILAVSPDRPEKLAESVEKGKLSYTLLSDAAMDAAKAFGIAFRVDDATVEKYKGYGIDLEAASGQDHHLLPVPAVFILGTDGKVKFVYVNPDYKTRLSADVLLAAARASLEEPRQNSNGGGK